MPPHKLKTTFIRPRGLGRRRHFRALLLIFFCLFGQYSGFTHLMTVRHALCPEHGEVIHSRLRGQALPPALSSAGQDGSAAQWTSGALSSSEDEHEHCLLLAQRRGQALPRLSPRPLVDSPAWGEQRLFSEELHRAPAVVLFRLAPKNSPPAWIPFHPEA